MPISKFVKKIHFCLNLNHHLSKSSEQMNSKLISIFLKLSDCLMCQSKSCCFFLNFKIFEFYNVSE